MRFASAIAALALVTRGRAFLVSHGDANVDASFHVGAVWLGGTLPYLSAWEYKPPGLFAFDALGLAVFGDAGLAGACFGTLAVVVTALAAGSLLEELLPGRAAGRTAAVGIVLFSVEDQGILGDAELYVNACIALALAALRGSRPSLVRAGAAGLAAGCALQMKLVALPLVGLVACEALRRAPGARGRSLAAFTALVLAPFSLEAALYARAQALPALWDATAGATVRRALGLRGHVRWENGPQWLAQLRVLAPAIELAPIAAFVPERGRYALLWAWLALAAATVAVSGEFYDRQFLLLVPPAVMLGTVGLGGVGRACGRPALVTCAMLLLTFGLHDYYEVAQSLRVVAHRAGGERAWRSGHYALLRQVLREQLKDDRSLYVVQDSPMLYDDLGAAAPTPYAFSGNLLEPAMWPMLGLRGRDELARILRTRPHYIAAGRLDGALDPASVALLHTVLRSRYRPVARVDATTIYALRPGARAPVQSRPSRSST